MLSRKNLDELSASSREFYERALMKMSLSLVFAALAFVFLGFACQSGGLSSSYNHLLDQDNLSSETKDMYHSYAGGYGFACFVYVLAFIIACAVSIYISPLLIGSTNEKKMLSNPQEIDPAAVPVVSAAPSVPSSIPVVPVATVIGAGTSTGYPTDASKNI